MKFFSQVLATVALMTIGATEATTEGWEIYRLGKTYGEPHGNFFTDTVFAKSGEAIHSVTIRTGERVNGVGIEVTPPGAGRTSANHGGNGGYPQTMKMQLGERIQCLEALWGPYHGRTRIRYIKITTSRERVVSNPDKAV
ncbi:hypothetical protein PHYSODRAFT_255357 [Phytophthora sojae]|uniref:Jacalin-type lectin domain-containing protein n=1 Tax=Phytophthora sojae (strain P6497) TaxID=1094619 RepID=G4ZA48_PHYSP|nr:hypothetical protein PHYSODRAFT_255357 [Phytophthora sojae]EGZ21187.1 hypothetical protein PHYSODRAFT_255357 [Phytophthora sojae]|eukprot:XP_009523904.1 hypothetical protein PHYSODRAFT_255357 [Phytophthora sojae]